MLKVAWKTKVTHLYLSYCIALYDNCTALHVSTEGRLHPRSGCIPSGAPQGDIGPPLLLDVHASMLDLQGQVAGSVSLAQLMGERICSVTRWEAGSESSISLQTGAKPTAWTVLTNKRHCSDIYIEHN